MRSHQESTGLSRPFSTSCAIGLWLCALMLAAPTASGQQESVVVVNTEGGSGYGVAYGSPGQIVTALHIVAGKSKIFVKWKNQESPASIEKIYKPADLALLRLQKSTLNIPPLEIYNAAAPMREDLNYWESEQNASKMSYKTTQLEKKAELGKLSRRLEKDQASFAKALCSDYPALNTKVLQFEHPDIKSAHSGSPLTHGKWIVGMVDGGGGKPIGAKTCVWAIPATEFQNLETHGIAPPVLSGCSSTNLYSGLRADNPHLDPALAGIATALAASQKNPFKLVDDSGDDLAFELAYRAPFEDIYDTMVDEEQGYVEELVQENEKALLNAEQHVSLKELYGQSIDIFQERETGATMAVPTMCKKSVQRIDGHTLVKISSPYAGITMLISVQHTNSVEESRAVRDWFREYIVSDRHDWVQEEKDIVEDFLDDPDDPYFSELVERIAHKDNSPVAELYASLRIDESNFLGVMVKVDDWEKLDKNPEERKFFYLMDACAILTDFPFY